MKMKSLITWFQIYKEDKNGLKRFMEEYRRVQKQRSRNKWLDQKSPSTKRFWFY